MRRVWQVAYLFILFAGVVCANGIVGCSLNGNSMNLNQCYSPNTFFTNPLTLDWGTAFGQANQTNDNPHSGTWSTNLAGVPIDVSIGSDFVGTGSPQLLRLNNEVLVWNGSSWQPPQFLPTSDPSHADFTTDGHFYAPGPAPQSGDGAHLLGINNGTGSMVINFGQGVTEAGLLLSVSDTGFNTNFDATIRAYDHNNVLLATYVINTQGVGSECAGMSQNPPQPCNDAPFIGIKSLTTGQIFKIVISATTPGPNGTPETLLLDSLQFQELQNGVPEPAVISLCGGGLVLIGLLRRRRPGVKKS